jgi:hypothetical protein
MLFSTPVEVGEEGSAKLATYLSKMRHRAHRPRPQERGGVNQLAIYGAQAQAREFRSRCQVRLSGALPPACDAHWHPGRPPSSGLGRGCARLPPAPVDARPLDQRSRRGESEG